MIKKYLAVSLIIAMIGSFLSGCGGGNDAKDSSAKDTSKTTETANVDTATSEEDPITVSIFCSYAGEDPHGKYVYDYANAFMEEHKNIKIKITAVSSNDIYTKLAAMAPTPDDLPTLFFTGGDQAPSLYELGFMEDLNKYLDKETISSFAPGIVESCTLDDVLAYYPIDVQPLAVIYRTDRFEEAGLEVPTTWEEFLECAKALTVDTDNEQNKQWGFSLVGSNNSSGQSRFMSYLWSNGLKVVSYNDSKDEWETDVKDKAFLDAFSFWTDMNNKYGVVPTGITEVDYPTAANYFAMGYTSMMMTGSNALGVAYASNPDLKGKVGSFKIPGGHAGTMLNSEGYALCKSASEEEKTAAVEFLKFFSTYDKDLMFWQSSGKIPATVEGEEADYISGSDYAGYLDTIQSECLPVLNFAGLSGAKTLLGDAYSGVFSEEMTNEEAVDKLSSGLEELLDDYN